MTDENEDIAVGLAATGSNEDDRYLRFEAFVRAQYRDLVRFLCRRSCRENAEEIAQDAVISLLEYRGKVEPDGWKPLLYRIAINHSIKRGQREANRLHLAGGDDVEQLADDAPLPEDEAERTQRMERLQMAIQSLPPKRRRVYLLRHGHGLSHAQIALQCGISRKMVEKHLAKALAHLQRQVGRAREGDF